MARPSLLSTRVLPVVPALLVALMVGGCTNDPEQPFSGPKPSPIAVSRTPPRVTPTPVTTMTRQPWDEPPFFRKGPTRTLYWKAKAGSCIHYTPLHKDRPVYYDPFPSLELVPCSSGEVTHKVVKRFDKYGRCLAGQGRYTLSHPKMSHQIVMTLCLRSLTPPSPLIPNIRPKR